MVCLFEHNLKLFKSIITLSGITDGFNIDEERSIFNQNISWSLSVFLSLPWQGQGQPCCQCPPLCCAGKDTFTLIEYISFVSIGWLADMKWKLIQSMF